jgi:hypothetical protein
MWNHYGLDWIAMGATFLAIYSLGNKQRGGFGLMMLGNLCWIGVGLSAASVAMSLANCVFLIMNLRGLVRWSGDAEATS